MISFKTLSQYSILFRLGGNYKCYLINDPLSGATVLIEINFWFNPSNIN